MQCPHCGAVKKFKNINHARVCLWCGRDYNFGEQIIKITVSDHREVFICADKGDEVL